jgi:S-adenosylmethionine:tRNA ribosyltransferase-isomerase
MSLTKKNSYFYDLPENLIAYEPMKKRSESRLMYLDKSNGQVKHYHFSQLPDLLKAGDLLVLNNTKVIPARLIGKKITGAEVEVFLLNQIDDTKWECLVKPGRRLKPGSEVIFADNLNCKILDYADDGSRIVEFFWKGSFWKILEKIGNMPLPPYIKRKAVEMDKTTYQTVYAETRGSVAAPTAGLHFTKEIFRLLEEKGVQTVEVLLHVGLGTFRPVKEDDIKNHKMHSEYCQISAQTAEKINNAKAEGRRVIAVGTTSTRTLESFAQNGQVQSGSKWTDIFIYPGIELQIIDGLITNFHMPESTLLMLISAFAGYENVMNAYKIAVEKKYRFFSYGDSMLIL